MRDAILHGLTGALIAVVGYLFIKYRAFKQRERKLDELAIKTEYEGKLQEFNKHDLDTRVKLSNERLGLTKPEDTE